MVKILNLNACQKERKRGRREREEERENMTYRFLHTVFFRAKILDLNIRKNHTMNA